MVAEQGEQNMTDFRKYILETTARLKQISEKDAAVFPTQGKWSAKEIIGHLIDSASNNHKRFVEATMKDDLVFDGYAQDEWVGVQKYNECDWLQLVELWKLYNLHIAHIIDSIASEIKLRKVTKHNLHQVAWKLVPEDESTSLDYFMNDYIGHCKHHINQILI